MSGVYTIVLPMPLGLKTVNCYLIKTAAGFVLVDTGGSNSRKYLLEQLKSAGCTPGSLTVVILTHGDFDHIGNAAFLRKTYATRLAMNSFDTGMAEKGDMFHNRQKPNILIKTLIPVLIGFQKNDHFTPDILLEDGQSLAPFGMDARVVSIPGHSKGSIGVLTTGGEFFCGDLYEYTGQKPALNSLMDDPGGGKNSAERLADLEVKLIYPGHGAAFSRDQL